MIVIPEGMIEFLEQGWSPMMAASKVGVGYTSFSSRRKKDPEFAALVKKYTRRREERFGIYYWRYNVEEEDRRNPAQ